jgi:hypothetical protein
MSTYMDVDWMEEEEERSLSSEVGLSKDGKPS